MLVLTEEYPPVIINEPDKDKAKLITYNVFGYKLEINADIHKIIDSNPRLIVSIPLYSVVAQQSNAIAISDKTVEGMIEKLAELNEYFYSIAYFTILQNTKEFYVKLYDIRHSNFAEELAQPLRKYLIEEILKEI